MKIPYIVLPKYWSESKYKLHSIPSFLEQRCNTHGISHYVDAFYLGVF